MTHIELLAEQNRSIDDLNDRAVVESYFNFYLTNYPENIHELFDINIDRELYGTAQDPYILISTVLFDGSLNKVATAKSILFKQMADDFRDRVEHHLEEAKRRLAA